MAKHHIYIPIVSTASEQVELWEVNARLATAEDSAKDSKAEDKKLLPAAFQLHTFNRHESGKRAFWAVKRYLEDIDKEGALGLVGELDKRRLESRVGEDWKIKDNSSDLGLALAFLLELGIADTSVEVFAATGELTDSILANSPGDMPVKTVGDIEQKLKCILHNKKHGGNVFKKLGMVFTPWHYKDNNGELHAVGELEVVKDLYADGVNVSVYPVNSFSEVAQHLGINSATVKQRYQQALEQAEQERQQAQRRRKYWQAGALGLAVGSLAFLANIAWYLCQDIELTWRPMPGAEGPYVLSADKTNRCALAKRPGDYSEWAAPAGSTLSWQMQIGTNKEADSWAYKALRWSGFGHYHVAVALVGKTSGVHGEAVIIPGGSKHGNDSFRPVPGQIFSYEWPLLSQQEDNILVVMVNRLWPFNTEDIVKGLPNTVKPDAQGIDLPAVKTYLQSQSHAFKPFYFQTRADVQTCPQEP